MPQTLNSFLQDIGKMLYRYLRKRGLTHEDAEDIVQDTCYKFLLYKDGIRADIAVNWLYRVATNQFYDLKRKEKRYVEVNIDEIPILSFDYLPELSYIKKEKAHLIRHTLTYLSDLHQELLILKYELDLPYKSIAGLLNMNENTLKTHVKRAKEKFIKVFEEANQDE